MVKLLHQSRADLDALDTHGQTALMVASAKGYVDVVKILHETKAGLDVRDKKGRTAIFAAAKHARTDVLKVRYKCWCPIYLQIYVYDGMIWMA